MMVEELHDVGERIYINQLGIEYLAEEISREWVNKFAYTSPLLIASIYKDEDKPERSLYYVRFEEDKFEQYMFELHPNEVSDQKLELSSERLECDLLNEEHGTTQTTGYFEMSGKELGALVDRKQKAYGNSVQQSYDVIKVFMKPYSNKNGTYTIPESLLMHLLLQVRIIDKQNRIFNNPDGDLMEENTYKDIAGYGLLGEHMT